MKLTRTVSAVVVLALAASSALAGSGYSELRHRYSSIDPAIAALPDSGIQGALNRISATLERSGISELPAGSSTQLPANFERNLADAIESARVEFEAGWTSLSPAQAFTVLQVLDVIAFRRTLELYSDAAWVPCVPPSSGCGNPLVLQALDRLAVTMNPAISAVSDAYSMETSASGLYPAAPPIMMDEDVNSQTAPWQVDQLRGTFGVLGVENIDYN